MKKILWKRNVKVGKFKHVKLVNLHRFTSIVCIQSRSFCFIENLTDMRSLAQ